MNTFSRLLALLLPVGAVFFSCTTNCNDAVNMPSNEPSTYAVKANNTAQELRIASDRYYLGLNSILNGDASGMDSVWSHAEDIVDMNFFGGKNTGWKAVDSAFEAEAKLKLHGSIECKDVIVVAGTDIGYTICTEKAYDMYYKDNPVELNLRATNIFRIEHGEWKLFHHHSDISSTLQKAAAAVVTHKKKDKDKVNTDKSNSDKVTTEKKDKKDKPKKHKKKQIAEPQQ